MSLIIPVGAADGSGSVTALLLWREVRRRGKTAFTNGKNHEIDRVRGQTLFFYVLLVKKAHYKLLKKKNIPHLLNS